MSSSFVHLHNHTEYSMLDGASKIKPMVAEAARLGQPALGITDHGYLFGAFEFYKECVAAGIKPVIGLEAYVTPGTSRFERSRVQWGEPWQKADDVSAGGAYNHLTLLATSTEGVHNLFRLGTEASLDGQMGKWPRADRELLERYHKGLVVFTGCPSGAVQTRMRLGQWDEAVREAAELRDIFGKDNFYVELMDHGIEFERKTRAELLKLAQLMDAPMVVTNDSHYVSAKDARTQEALLAINSGSNLTEPPNHKGGTRFAFEGEGYYLRSTEEMRALFPDHPAALDATLEIAERSDIQFRTVADGANYMPRFPTPPGEDERSWFIKEIRAGLRKRFPNGIPPEVMERSEFEEGVILEMGFPGYFLVVADFINWAKQQGIRVGPGRGSGAGSMVAYAMGITELNPLEHGLLFERFLNPERVSMPDFDVDFDERRRDEVIGYVRQKYGNDRVAQVLTYGRIKAKQALKDSARILGYEFQIGEKLTKALPPDVMGKTMPISGIFDPEHSRYQEATEFRKLYEESPELHPVVEMAKSLEGLTRQWGVHACAVIMSSERLADIIPLMSRPSDGVVLTQFDYPSCESLGLLKMDFLGIRNLTVISDTLDNVAAAGKEVPDMNLISLDDPETYSLLGRADTLGIFQLDGAGMRELLRLMKPDHFEDISAVGALYRPGPMGADSHTNYALRKNGRQAITPIHPELEEPLADILGPTYGLIVYQEQVMQIAQRLAGYSLGQADMLRRAMGKKKKEILDKEFEPFKNGMLERGYSLESIEQLWDILVPFADYAFNKSHSAAYGLVSYWMAYLKAHYPTEFMAALLTSTKANKDRRALYLAECRHMDILVLPPDVNHSRGEFSPDGKDIRFGLSSIQNVGENVVQAIIQTRKDKGEFVSFQDFLDKVPQVVCNKRTIQSLIKAGAFDSLGNTRRALIARSDEAVDAVIDVKKNEAHGQFDLFADLAGLQEEDSSFAITIPDLPEWDRKVKLANEREMLGLYVSDHPLRGIERALSRHQDSEIASLLEQKDAYDGKTVKIAGLVSSVQAKLTKNGAPWAIATVEDMTGSLEVLFFPKQYEKVQGILQEDTIVQVVGRASVRDENSISVMGTELRVLDLREDNNSPLEIQLELSHCVPDTLNLIRGVLSNYPGSQPVYLYVPDGSKTVQVQVDDSLRVHSTPSMVSELKAALGADAVRRA